MATRILWEAGLGRLVAAGYHVTRYKNHLRVSKDKSEFMTLAIAAGRVSEQRVTGLCIRMRATKKRNTLVIKKGIVDMRVRVEDGKLRISIPCEMEPEREGDIALDKRQSKRLRDYLMDAYEELA